MYGFVIPTRGWNLLTKLLAGQKLNISRVMVGSGRLPNNADPAAFTDLVQPVAAATSTIPQLNGRTCSFVVEYRSDLNGGLETGFWLSEFGVYATDPDVGEVLLYYGTLGDYPQYVSEYAGGSIDIRRFPVAISLTDDVSVDINYPAVAFMTAEDVDEYFRLTALPIALEEAQKLVDIHNNVTPDTHPDIRVSLAGFNSRVGRLEDMMLNDVTGNPFMITFGDLTGVIVSGVWNQSQQRIEF